MSEQELSKAGLIKVIEKALRNGDSDLKLSAKGLTELPPEVGQLVKLKRLDLSYNDLTTLPIEIGNLRSLKEIDISSNRFSEFPSSLTRLKNLEKVRLVGSRSYYDKKVGIRVLPEEINQIKSLKFLDLSLNRLKSLPSTLGELADLQFLLLTENALGSLPFELGNLSNIRVITLGNNHLSSLPASFAKLKNLVFLSVSNNNFHEIPEVISRLKSLKILTLSGNKISKIPSSIESLKNLKVLLLGHSTVRDGKIDDSPTREYVENIFRMIEEETSQGLGMLYTADTDGGNNIATIPSSIGTLANLEVLLMIGNNVRVLHPAIRQLTKLKIFDIRDNLLSIPPEILSKTNEPKIIWEYYFEQLESKKKKQLSEAKVIFVGQGSVGKTSLVEQILHGTFDQHQTKTEGISINRWQIEVSREAGVRFQVKPYSQVEIEKPFKVHTDFKIRLNIWDFGGQEIMHATHQFFLTKRSLYLLVLDARLTQEENRVEYWLKIIQSFGGESPVLIVGNKTDQHPLDIDRTGLQKKYPNIVGILETSAATGAGIEALKAEIAKQVDTLPHVRDLLPETWFTVKSKLEELGRNKNFITQDEYLTLCSANDVTDETSQHTLIGFLHDLGVVLHFQDDPRLEALGILNPQWVTNGVYKILNSHELFQNQGTLTLPILNKTLTPPEYPSNKRLFIVDMMKKFELCYDIEPDKSFLIPDLLPKDEPFTGDHEWDGALAFQVHYNVLPTSIISRFIVRMNAFVHKTVWRSGVVLKSGENTALVKADTEDRKIYIWVSGDVPTRREFLAVIRAQFDAIHKTIAKIEATEKVPLPNAPEADPVDLTFLQRAASEGRESLPVQVGDRIIDLLVKELLNKIQVDGGRNININIGGNVGGNFIVGDNNTANFIQQKFEPIYEAIESSSRDTTEKQDLIAEVDEIKDEVVKGDQASESFLSRRLRNLKKMAPDIAEVALSALAGPGAAFGMIVKNVAKKIKEEAK